MDVNRWLTVLQRPETSRDKWLRAAITGASAALALLIAIVLFATAGGDDDATETWETTTGTVTDVRAHTENDDDGNVIETFWFVTYEYTTDAYYIKTVNLDEDVYAKGDPATVYYAPDDHDTSRLTAPDNDENDDGGGSTAGMLLLLVAGLLTAFAAVQIVDLRRGVQDTTA